MRIRRRYGMVALAVAVWAPGGAEAQTVDLVAGWWDVHRSGWRVEGRVVLGNRHPEAPPPRRAQPAYRWEGPVYKAPAGHGRGGPAFCRSGAGHPVHGRRWCDEHRHYRDAAWYRVDARGVYFQRVSGSPGREFGARDLERILGRRVMDDLRGWARDLGTRDGLRGRWVPVRERGVRVLQVRAGRTPVAEFTDWNGDRRVDELMVYAYR